MFNPRAMLAIASVGALVACHSANSSEPDLSHADIANITKVHADFPQDFKVRDIAKTGIDPRLLEQHKLPPDIKFDPPECARSADEQVLPSGVKGNMAAVTAEGAGNRFIVIAVETSEPIPVKDPSPNCQKIQYSSPVLHGQVEVIDAPKIDGVRTQGAHRVVQATAAGKTRTGELYTYVARFGTFAVIVSANPLVIPNQPVAPVDTKRAADLLSAGVAAVKG